MLNVSDFNSIPGGFFPVHIDLDIGLIADSLCIGIPGSGNFF